MTGQTAWRTSDYRDAIEHLPESATLVLRNLAWEEYERLLEEMGHRPGVRITYDNGTVEIMSPSLEHEAHKDFILRLALALSDELGLPIETRGSTTWRRRALGQGLEPDLCFYVTDLARIIGSQNLEVESVPPPDVAVEVDIAHSSVGKFGIYAALGVPEIWRYDGQTMQFYELAGGAYRATPGSRFFRGLTPAMAAEALESSKREGQTNALVAFRHRWRDSVERDMR